jgi:uncharacterized protein (TIGR00299 family) protein
LTGHIHITPLGGMAGDMFVAAMLDAFPEFIDPVTVATGAVLPHRNAELTRCTKAGIAARSFEVPEQNETAPIRYPDMNRMLLDADLSDATLTHARVILRLLAKAEAKVHAVPLEQVHFHEIADWDTLADLTAVAALIGLLDGWSWSLDPLPLGGGTIRTAHCRLPVPAPATAHLLEGLTVRDDGVGGERVTPTGAAIMRYIADNLPLRPRPMGRLQATGYGAGSRDLPGLANVVVVQVITGPTQSGDTVTVLEWDIDDMTGEEIAVAIDHLRGCDGVLDLVTLPMTGKKGRHVTGFRLIALQAHIDTVAQAVFAQTTTLGLRIRHDQRLILPRDVRPGVKVAVRPSATTAKAESDAVADQPTLADRRAQAREREDAQ